MRINLPKLDVVLNPNHLFGFLLHEVDCLAMLRLIVIELLQPSKPKLLTIRVARELNQQQNVHCGSDDTQTKSS